MIKQIVTLILQMVVSGMAGAAQNQQAAGRSMIITVVMQPLDAIGNLMHAVRWKAAGIIIILVIMGQLALLQMAVSGNGMTGWAVSNAGKQEAAGIMKQMILARLRIVIGSQVGL